MEWITIDVLGPLPTTDEGNQYLLIAADYFTKWVEAYPLPNQEATTVAEVLVKEFVCCFSTPHIIHSNQGWNFESAVFAEMCRLLGITKTRTTPFHPESDGMVERFNCLTCSSPIDGVYILCTWYSWLCTGSVNFGRRPATTNWLAPWQAWRWSFPVSVIASQDGESAWVCSTEFCRRTVMIPVLEIVNHSRKVTLYGYIGLSGKRDFHRNSWRDHTLWSRNLMTWFIGFS